MSDAPSTGLLFDVKNVDAALFVAEVATGVELETHLDRMRIVDGRIELWSSAEPGAHITIRRNGGHGFGGLRWKALQQ